jgi:hypothetical protein
METPKIIVCLIFVCFVPTAMPKLLPIRIGIRAMAEHIDVSDMQRERATSYSSGIKQ